MKGIYKALTIFICIALLPLSFSVTATAEEKGWSVTAESYASATVSDDGGSISVICNENKERAVSSAEAETALDGMTASETVMAVDFSLTLKQTQTRVIKNITLTDGVSNILLMSITGNSMRIFGAGEDAAVIETDREYKTEIWLNTQSGMAALALDGNYLAVTDISILRELDRDSLKLKLNVEYMRAAATISECHLNDLSVNTAGQFRMTRIQADEEILTDNGICKISGLQNGIRLIYSGFESAEMLEKDNYSLITERGEVDFELTKQDGAIIITPSVAETGEYSFKIVKIVDCFSQEYNDLEKEYSFTVVPDDYEKNEITVNSEKTEIKLGESVDIIVNVSGTNWENGSVYINNTAAASFGTNEFIYTFTPDSAGTYIIKADITDSLGRTAAADTVITVIPNDAPEIEISGYEQAITFNAGEDKKLTINASDSDGISKIEIEVDGALKEILTQPPYTIDFSDYDAGIGVHEMSLTAYDSFGMTSSLNVTVSIEKNLTSMIFEDSEFNESTAGRMASGLSIVRQRGYLTTDNHDDEHGNVLRLGMDENCDTVSYNANQYTYGNISMPSSGLDTIGIEFDMNVLKSPVSNGGVSMGLRKSNAAVTNLLSVGSGTLTIGSRTYAFNAGEWYKVRYVVRLREGEQRFSAYINDEPVCTDVTADFGESITHLRFYTTGNANNLCDVAFDDIKVYKLIGAPTIASIGYDEISYSELIPFEAERINAVLSSSLEGSSINAQTVSLLTSYGKAAALENVRYNRDTMCIELYPASPLIQGCRYTVRIDGSAVITGDEILEEPVYAFFTTTTDSKNPFVDEIKFERKRDSANVTFTLSNVNTEGKIYGIATILDKYNKFRVTKAYEFTAENRDYTVSVPAEQGETVRFSVINTSADGQVIRNAVSE